MVAAYLRGLLKPTHQHGLRSAISEEVILEGMASEMMSHNMVAGVSMDMALIPALSEKGIRSTVEKSSARLNRAAELRALDLFKVGEQMAIRLKLSNPKNELSLYQLYQIAEKQGIFDAFDEDFDEERDTKPLL